MLKILKFGGTSVSTNNSRQQVLQIIQSEINNNNKVIVVVSALGRNPEPYSTDALLNIIKNNAASYSNRELDLIFSVGEQISSCLISSMLNSRGYNSMALTGGQAGIITTNHYSNGDIKYINKTNIKNILSRNIIPVVCGCQGITEAGDVVVLGRGGSDITACALGYYIEADEVVIYTDVDGIMTCDPKRVRYPKLINSISYNLAEQMAISGAKVIHPKAVEYLKKQERTKLYVKSTFKNNLGTLISSEVEKKYAYISAITVKENINNDAINMARVNIIGNMLNEVVEKVKKSILKTNIVYEENFIDYNIYSVYVHGRDLDEFVYKLHIDLFEEDETVRTNNHSTDNIINNKQNETKKDKLSSIDLKQSLDLIDMLLNTKQKSEEKIEKQNNSNIDIKKIINLLDMFNK